MIPRPSREEELLLLAALGPQKAARDAWLDVVRDLDLASLPHESHAVLPLLARGLHRLGCRYADLPRLDGVRRRTWYVNTRYVPAVVKAIDCLHVRGVSPFVTGGLGVLVTGGDLGMRRLATADVVIAKDAHERAADALRDAGWLRSGHRRDGALLDLHAEGWTDDEDHALTLRWGDGRWPYDGFDAARRVVIGSSSTVPVAAPADLLAFTLVDAPRLPGYPPARLHADALQLVPLVDPAGWERFARVVIRRGDVTRTRETLRYLADRLHAPVSAHLVEADAWPSQGIVERLADRAATRSDTLAAYLRCRTSAEAIPLTGFLQRAWDVPHATRLPGVVLRRVWARLR